MELRFSPAERLAEIGALVDRALHNQPPQGESRQELKERVVGIVVMRQRLATLGVEGA